jgi:hypothetical protein
VLTQSFQAAQAPQHPRNYRDIELRSRAACLEWQGLNGISARSSFSITANRDRLDPDKLLVRKDQDRVQEAGKYRERNTPGDRATRGEGTSDGATRTAQSNALARVCRPAANRNRVRRNAKKGGSLRVAQPQPLVELAVGCHTGKAQLEGAELPRLGIAAAGWAVAKPFRRAARLAEVGSLSRQRSHQRIPL